jgi:hypothetical protein
MAQSKVSLVLPPELIAAVISFLLQIEALFKDLIMLEPKERMILIKYGQKSEAFVRTVLRLMAQNPNVIPPSFDLAEAQADLAARDALIPIQEILHRVTMRVDHTVAALGHDVMTASLEGYKLLKVSGDKEGLEELRKEAGARFKRRRSKSEKGAGEE